MKRSLQLTALMLLATSTLPGCYRIVVTPYKMCLAPNAEYKVEKLEAELEGLEKQYESRATSYQESIDEQKSEIQSQLDAGETEKALSLAGRLWIYTHPCEQNDCKKATKENGDKGNKSLPYFVKDDNLIRAERMNREDAFLKEQLQVAFEQATAMVEAKNYLRAEQTLAPVELTKYDYRVRKKMLELRASNAEKWAAASEELAKSAVADAPGAAILLYLNAAKLARQNGDNPRADKLTKQARELRAKVIDDFTYEVFIANASGNVAGDVKGKFPSFMSEDYRQVSSKSDRTDVIIKMSTNAPSYRTETTTESDTFEFTSHFKKVTNPRHAELVDLIKLNRTNYNNCSNACSNDSCCRLNYTNGSSSTECGYDNVCRIARESKGFMDTFSAELSSTPAQVDEPVMGDHRYKFTQLSHYGQTRASYDLAHTDNRSSRDSNYQVQTVARDRNHPAYNHKDGGVGSRNGSMPSQSKVYDQLVAEFLADVDKQLDESYADYLEQLRTGGSMSDENGKLLRAHGMVTVHLLTGGGGDKSEINNAMNLPDAWDMLQTIAP